MYKKTIIGIVILFAVGLAAFGGNYLYELFMYQKIISEIKIDNVDLLTVSDGVYDGAFDAKMVQAEVRVTVVDHKITDINLVRHYTDRGASAEVVVDEVMNKQTLKVDTVSGATNSSKVILKAIENALVDGVVINGVV